MNQVNPVRFGYHTLTPYIAVDDADKAHAFYARAFGAETIARLDGPDGRVMHGALRIGDSIVVVVDEMPEVGLRSPSHGGVSSILISAPDADGLFARAVAEGATPIAPVSDTFSGDRHGLLVCPFGHRWIVATRTHALTDEQIRERWRQMFSARD